MNAKHYYEAHVTIEPVFEDRLAKVEELSKRYGFKVAKLLMQKRPEDTAERSRYDTFTTGHGKGLDDIKLRTSMLVLKLRQHGYTVWRYKIEDTVLDSRIEDELGLLVEQRAAA